MSDRVERASGASDSLRLLILTSLDCEELRNSVEENHAVGHARNGHSVTVLFKRMNRSGRLRDLLIDTLTCRVRHTQRDGIDYFALDPFCNPRVGIRARSIGRASGRHQASAARALLRLGSPLGSLRDASFVVCSIVVLLFKKGGAYDACLGFGAWGGLAGWLTRLFGRADMLVYEDRDYEPGLVPDRPRRWLTGALERFVIRRADRVVSVGARLADLRQRQTRRLPIVLPNGVDWDRFQPARDAREARFVGAGVETPPVLIYVGNLSAWSGLELGIRAFARILPCFPDAVLRIVGDGLPNEVEALRRLTRELDLGLRVEFLGARPPTELANLLAQADVGLAHSEPVPFRIFAQPLKLMEYLAAALPVVVTEATEAADLVTRAEAGLVVGYDVDALALAFAELLGDRTRARSLGRNGSEFARTRDWRRVVERELALIDETRPSRTTRPDPREAV